jgi:hypothetical protein
MSVVNSRLELISKLADAIKHLKYTDGDPACISDNNILINTFKLVGRIGSESVNGETFKICYPIKCRDGKCTCRTLSHHLALKRIPILDQKTLSYSRQPISYEALRYELWAELLFMRLCKILVEQNITPNLPIYINYFFCNSCIYENKVLQRYNGQACAVVINELANEGDLKSWSKTRRSTAQWINAYFQIFCGLYALQKYFNATHHDLHWGNVLVHKIRPGGYWRYTIDGRTYDVPNMGYLFVLWDFGFARIPDKVEIRTNKRYYREPSQNPRLVADYRRIMSAPFWRSTNDEVLIPISSNLRIFGEMIQTISNHDGTLYEVIRLYKLIYRHNKSHRIIGHYSLDKSLQLPDELKSFENKDRTASRWQFFNRDAFKPFRQKNQQLLQQLVETKETEVPVYYPPQPVDDIDRPNDYVYLNLAMVESLQNFMNQKALYPEFVQETIRTLTKMARLITWLQGLDVPSEVIESLPNSEIKKTELQRLIQRLQEFDAPSIESLMVNKSKKIKELAPLIKWLQAQKTGTIEVYTVITRADLARLIKWLQVLDAPSEMMRSLIEPIRDYFTSPSPHNRIIQEIQNAIYVLWNGYMQNTIPPVEWEHELTNILVQLYQILNQRSSQNFDVNDVLVADRHGLSDYACLFESLENYHEENLALLIDTLDNKNQPRVIKLLTLAHIFATLMETEDGLSELVERLSIYEEGYCRQNPFI